MLEGTPQSGHARHGYTRRLCALHLRIRGLDSLLDIAKMASYRLSLRCATTFIAWPPSRIFATTRADLCDDIACHRSRQLPRRHRDAERHDDDSFLYRPIIMPRAASIRPGRRRRPRAYRDVSTAITYTRVDKAALRSGFPSPANAAGPIAGAPP